MISLKADLDRVKEYNIKLINAKSKQEEINELISKCLTIHKKNNGQNSCSLGRKEREI